MNGTFCPIFGIEPELDWLMEEKTFKFAVKWLEPQVTAAITQVGNSGVLAPGNTISRIDVTGAGYFIKVQGDSVSAILPYYGERQMGGGYNSNEGIQFDGLAKNLEVLKDAEKFNYTVKFSQRSASETYFIRLDVSPSLNSTAIITSSQRNRIRYVGTANAIKTE